MGRAIALLSRPGSDVILITAGMAAAVVGTLELVLALPLLALALVARLRSSLPSEHPATMHPASLAPNPSIKGTSRKRAAPYVER